MSRQARHDIIRNAAPFQYVIPPRPFLLSFRGAPRPTVISRSAPPYCHFERNEVKSRNLSLAVPRVSGGKYPSNARGKGGKGLRTRKIRSPPPYPPPNELGGGKKKPLPTVISRSAATRNLNLIKKR